jgi:DNA-binding PadR family transcriptional regulator
MRRKPGTLVPLEIEICLCAAHVAAEFHGYELAKHLATHRDRRALVGYGTLYRALARLVDLGMLTSRWEDPHAAARENRPLRRLYTLTTAGRRAAREAERTGRAEARAQRVRKSWAPA